MKSMRKELELLVGSNEAQKLIEAMSGDKEKYQKYFQKMMKKYGVNSPADFKDEKKKKEFFDAVDKGWKEDTEESISEHMIGMKMMGNMMSLNSKGKMEKKDKKAYYCPHCGGPLDKSHMNDMMKHIG